MIFVFLFLTYFTKGSSFIHLISINSDVFLFMVE